MTSSKFQANFAATITLGSGVATRTFVVINDAVPGFNLNDDALIDVSGFTGTFNTSRFVTS
ncbi:MAG: bluetail domain-containing putative surface protein [Cyanobacteriota bacterium]